jgi:hypothetical protein
MNNDMTYWTACIVCLPPEKRAAAERAFREIAEGGENGMWPRLFLLMEAHAAYVHSIPAKITEAGENAAAAVRQAGAVNPSLSQEDKADLLKAIQQRGGIQSAGGLDGIGPKLEEVAQEVTRLNAQVSRLRHYRIGMALFLICLSMAISGGGVFWWMHRDKEGVLVELPHNELRLSVYPGQNKLDVFVRGPVGKTVQIDKNGVSGVGVEIPVR